MVQGFGYEVSVFGVSGGSWFSRYVVSRLGVSGTWFRSLGFYRFWFRVSRRGSGFLVLCSRFFAVGVFGYGV